MIGNNIKGACKIGALIIAFLVTGINEVVAQQRITGQWNSGRENSIVKIYQVDGEYYGKVITSDRKEAIDKLALKDLNIQGTSWSGKIYIFKRQKWFDVTIEPTESTLILTISNGILQRQIEWAKVSAKP
jgi:uncharacterized protein (DUF2147 family)